MTINRNNYEEYFLLYTDNELSVAERNKVEDFVTANPDLQEELVMLQQSVIRPMDVDFPGKAGLLKPEVIDSVTEEKLLLLLDDELKGKEKAAMLSLIQYNKAVKKEWDILQQTKYSAADIMVFSDKASLYKKEESKVVAIKWWRLAAAALLIGAGLWGTVSYLNTGKPNGPVVETSGTLAKEETKSVANSNDSTQKIIDETRVVTGAVTANNAGNNRKEISNSVINKKLLPLAKDKTLQPEEPPAQTNSRVNTAGTKEKEENEDELLERINNNSSNEKLYVNVTPETIINKTESTIDNSSAVKNTIAINTSFKNGTGDNDTFVFEEDEDKPRKTKLGGFFKRVKRVIERKTKIKTGNDDEVRIANMSFAMQ